MNFLRSFNASKAAATPILDKNKLPLINAFVEVSLGGRSCAVPVEEICQKFIEVRKLPGCAIGASATFDYKTATGRYRFRAECTSIIGDHSSFALPQEIRTIETFPTFTNKFRLETVLTVQFRYAPDGVGYGEFKPARTKNLSADGVALVIGRELKKGTQMEIKFDFNGHPLILLGELTRPTEKEVCDKYLAGLRFLNIDASAESVIAAFIDSKIKGCRERSIAV